MTLFIHIEKDSSNVSHFTLKRFFFMFYNNFSHTCDDVSIEIVVRTHNENVGF